MPSLLASAFNSSLLHHLAEALLCNVAKPWHLLMLNSGKERFLSAHKTFDLVLYIVIGPSRRYGGAFSSICSQMPANPFFLPQPGVSMSHTCRGGWIWLVICRACTWYGSWCFQSGHCCYDCDDLCVQISLLQVPSFDRH